MVAPEQLIPFLESLLRCLNSGGIRSRDDPSVMDALRFDRSGARRRHRFGDHGCSRQIAPCGLDAIDGHSKSHWIRTDLRCQSFQRSDFGRPIRHPSFGPPTCSRRSPETFTSAEGTLVYGGVDCLHDCCGEYSRRRDVDRVVGSSGDMPRARCSFRPENQGPPLGSGPVLLVEISRQFVLPGGDRAGRYTLGIQSLPTLSTPCSLRRRKCEIASCVAPPTPVLHQLGPGTSGK